MPKNCPVCKKDCDFDLEEVKRADGLTGTRHKAAPKVEELVTTKPLVSKPEPKETKSDDLGL